MKCEWPGKSAKPSTSASSPTRDWPVVLVPAPKWESLEVCRQEIAVGEWVNKLVGAHLGVVCDRVIARWNLRDAMGHGGGGSWICFGGVWGGYGFVERPASRSQIQGSERGLNNPV